MKNLRNLVFILSVLVVTSCGRQANRSPIIGATTFDSSDLKKRIELKSNLLEIENPDDLIGSWRMTMIGDYILVAGQPYDEHLVKVFNTKGKTLGSFISMGRGPGELTAASNIGHSDIHRKFWVQGEGLGTVHVYDYNALDRLADGEFIMPLYSFDTFKEYVVDDIYIVGDTVFALPIMADCPKRIKIMDTTGAQIALVGDYPDYPDSPVAHDNRLQSELWNSNSAWAINEKLRRIAIFNGITDLLCIYDFDGKLIKRVHGPTQDLPVISVKASGRNGSFETVQCTLESIFGFQSATATDDKIWVSYEHTKWRDQEANAAKPFQIITFDWDGKPLELYQLDSQIGSFCIDNVTNTIYAMSYGDELLTFELP